jgi:uncharacterized protein (TIGR03083 family)
MELKPRYADGDCAEPLIRFEGRLPDPLGPMLRQRRRLADLLASLDEDQWARPSRCAEWAVKDVVAHLVTTDGFWAASITAGRQGEPSRFLAGFDPVSTPPQFVEPLRALSPAETLDAYDAALAGITAAVEGVDEGERGAVVAEAPPGHVPLDAVILHALWDSWIHERDIAIPLGLDPAEVDDEVAACVTYAAALGPGFMAMNGSDRRGALAVAAHDPDVHVVVELGPTVVVHVEGTEDLAVTATLTGRAAQLVDALAFRGPFEHPLAPEHSWLVSGLGEVFDQARPVA